MMSHTFHSTTQKICWKDHKRSVTNLLHSSASSVPLPKGTWLTFPLTNTISLSHFLAISSLFPCTLQTSFPPSSSQGGDPLKITIDTLQCPLLTHFLHTLLPYPGYGNHCTNLVANYGFGVSFGHEEHHYSQRSKVSPPRLAWWLPCHASSTIPAGSHTQPPYVQA